MAIIIISCLAPLNLTQQESLKNLIIELEAKENYCIFWSTLPCEILNQWYFPFHLEWENQTDNYLENQRDTKNIKLIEFDHDKWLKRLSYSLFYGKKEEEIERFHKKHFNHSYEILRNIKPDLFLSWNPFSYLTGVPYEIAKYLGIKVGIIEWGYLTNTIMIDSQGLGTLSSLHEKNIEQLIGDRREEYLNIGRKYRQFANNQPSIYQHSNKDDIVDQYNLLNRDKSPKILCLGMTDVDVGGIPDDHQDRLLHLPFHKSSYDLAVDIAKIHGGITIFKPHPIHNFMTSQAIEDINLYVVCNIAPLTLIDWADVVVISCSKLEFSCLLMNKPVVLMGTGFLFNKSCAYEVRNFAEINNVLAQAIKQEDYQEKQAYFEMFLGWLIGNYLISLDLESEFNFFRNTKQIAEDINNLFELERTTSSSQLLSCLRYQLSYCNNQLSYCNNQLSYYREKTNNLEYQILVRDTSFFWKLRSKWFVLKRILGLIKE